MVDGPLGAEQIAGSQRTLAEGEIKDDGKDNGDGEEHRMLEGIGVGHDPQFLHILGDVAFVAEEDSAVIGAVVLLYRFSVGVLAGIGVTGVAVVDQGAKVVDLLEHVGPFKKGSYG